MSIKPIDIKITIPKLQRISEINQNENNKSRNDMLTLEMQQQKRINNELKKVIESKKANSLKINNKEKREKNNEDTKKRKNKKTNEEKDKLKGNNSITGKRIDIKV